MTTQSAVPQLPYPKGIHVRVFEDDGRWDDYSAWFKRSSPDLEQLATARITLRHFTDTDEPAYTSDEWYDKALSLVEQYPNHVFIYTS